MLFSNQEEKLWKKKRNAGCDLSGDTTLMTRGLMTWRHDKVGPRRDFGFLPENDALQVERILYDACGGNAHPEHILLSGKIVGIWNAIQIGKIATGRPVRRRRRRDSREMDRKRKREKGKKERQENSYSANYSNRHRWRPQGRK